MSYDQPTVITYDLAPAAVAAAPNRTFRGPKGKSGRIVDIIASVTVTHVHGATTATGILVGHGSGGDLSAMAEWTVPAGAAPAAFAASATPGALKPGFRLPADTPVRVTGVNNAGTSNAGTIGYQIVIAWF